MIRVLCCGDVVGHKGARVLVRHLEDLKKKYSPHLIVVNGENSGQNGKGPSKESLKMLLSAGVHVITGGNHSFANREIYDVYQTTKNILRPCNYPSENPGVGSTILAIPLENDEQVYVGIINVQLRVFMREDLACPFKSVDALIAAMKNKVSAIIIDVHGEATAEKISFAYYIDGRASLIFGTHTHVQTSDDRILPQGTGYITDVGATCALNSSLGVKCTTTIQNFLTQMPVKFEIDDSDPFVTGALYAEIDEKTGKATHVERISLIV